MTLSIVIPVKDEAGTIASLAAEIEDACRQLDGAWEAVWVDDGSRDGTRARLLALGPGHRVIALERSCGQSAALMAGFGAARGEWIGTLDGDGQNDPADLPRLLEHARRGGFDMVNGIRHDRRDSRLRRFASSVANRLRNRLTHETVTDVGCATRVAQRRWLVQLPFFHGMHRFLPTLVRIRGGTRIAELPVNHRPRRHGRSKYSAFGRGWSALRDLQGVRWLQARQRIWQARELDAFDQDDLRSAEAVESPARAEVPRAHALLAPASRRLAAPER